MPLPDPVNLGNDPFGTRSPSVFGIPSGTGYGASAMQGRKRMLEREEEEDQEFVEELDRFKEDLTMVTNDFELLEFARKRVFTTTAATTADSSPSTTTAIGNGTVNAASSAEQDVGFPRTYPHMLAHLMKLTRVNFNNPHLSLSFFQYAQTHSVESYLFGCLAAAYNELIITRWKCFRDLDGVDAALREMEVNGVGWDRNTQKEVSAIVEEVGVEVMNKGVSRWGEGVYDVLARLERRVQKDVRDEEFKHEYRLDQKRKARADVFQGRTGGGDRSWSDRADTGADNDRYREAEW
jgi:hypothetical protein